MCVVNSILKQWSNRKMDNKANGSSRMRLVFLLLFLSAYFCAPVAEEWSKSRQKAREWYLIKSDLHPSSSIALKWTPEKNRQDYYQRKIFDRVPMKFNFVSIAANRSNSYLIGCNIEDSLKKIPVYTGDTIDKWVKINLNRLMDEQADNSIDNRKETYLIYGNIVKYFVTESSSYQCTLSIEVKITDFEKKDIWEGIVTEEAASWGRSLNAFVYQEVLSAALQNWFYSFSNNRKVLYAIGKDISEKWNTKINATPIIDK
jgi:hypothetical protein